MHGSTLLLRPRLLVVALAATTLAIAGCSDPAGPLPRSGPPQSLEFNIGSFGSQSILLGATGDTVLFVRRGSATPAALDSVRIVPSAAAWRQFWASAEAAGVHRWKGSYDNLDIADGTGWGLRIGLDGADIRAQGSNAYPDRRGARHLDMTPEFHAFVGALGALVGHDFGFGAPPEL